MDGPLSSDANAPRTASSASPSCDLPPWRLIPSREVSRLTGLSIQTLANHRVRGTGPAYVGAVRGKGNKVFYRRAEVEAFVARQQGQPKEGWEICRDWLAERGLTLENPTPEGVWWLAEQVDTAF